MTYGAKIELPNDLRFDENSVPFSLADVISLTTSDTSGSKTYTGFEGRTIRLYQVSSTTAFLEGSITLIRPYYHTMTITNNGIAGIAPTLSWSVVPYGNYLAASTVYVVMV